MSVQRIGWGVEEMITSFGTINVQNCLLPNGDPLQHFLSPFGGSTEEINVGKRDLNNRGGSI